MYMYPYICAPPDRTSSPSAVNTFRTPRLGSWNPLTAVAAAPAHPAVSYHGWPHSKLKVVRPSGWSGAYQPPYGNQCVMKNQFADLA